MMDRFEKKLPPKTPKKENNLDHIKNSVTENKEGLGKVEDMVYQKLGDLVHEFKSQGYAIEICKALGYSKKLVDDLTMRLETDTAYEKYLETYPKKHISMTDLKNYSHKNKLKLGKYLDTLKNRDEGKAMLVKVGWSEEFVSEL